MRSLAGVCDVRDSTWSVLLRTAPEMNDCRRAEGASGGMSRLVKMDVPIGGSELGCPKRSLADVVHCAAVVGQRRATECRARRQRAKLSMAVNVGGRSNASDVRPAVQCIAGRLSTAAAWLEAIARSARPALEYASVPRVVDHHIGQLRVSRPAIPGPPRGGQIPPRSSPVRRPAARRTSRGASTNTILSQNLSQPAFEQQRRIEHDRRRAVPRLARSTCASSRCRFADGSSCSRYFSSRGPSGGGANTILRQRAAIDLRRRRRRHLSPQRSPMRRSTSSAARKHFVASSIGIEHDRAPASASMLGHERFCRWRCRRRCR